MAASHDRPTGIKGGHRTATLPHLVAVVDWRPGLGYAFSDAGVEAYEGSREGHVWLHDGHM